MSRTLITDGSGVDERPVSDAGRREIRSRAGLLLALGATVVSLLVAEFALRAAAPVSDPYSAFRDPAANSFIRSELPRNWRVEIRGDEPLPGLPARSVVTTNNYGFRGDSLISPKPAYELRIFLVGGSSMECLSLDDSAAVNAVLQRELATMVPPGTTVRVFNAAVSGTRSDDHVALLAHRLVHLQPDLIVVMAGINDLIASIYGLDYLHYARDFRDPRVHYGPGLMAKLLLTEFQIPRRVYYGWQAVRSSGGKGRIMDGVARPNYLEAIQRRRAAPVTDQAPPANIDSYARNLRTLAGTANAQGSQVVFVTQASTWNSTVDPRVEAFQWMLYVNGRTYRPDLMDAALERLNDAMRRVADSLRVPIYDLARVLPKSTRFLYDDVHFTVAGASEAATGLARFISERRLIRPRVSTTAPARWIPPRPQ